MQIKNNRPTMMMIGKMFIGLAAGWEWEADATGAGLAGTLPT
jgi:hypothetical protein